MKKIITLSLSFICLSFFSFAQSSTEALSEMEYDTNKDGKLDRTEFNNTPAQQVKAIDLNLDKTFDRMDADHDGFLDKGELRKARAKRNKRQGTRGAGKMKKQKNKRQQANGKRKKVAQENRAALQKRFNGLDRNGNKVLTFREFKRGAKLRPNYTRARAKDQFERMDSNHDGLLAPGEFIKAQAQQKGKRKVRRRVRGRR